MVWWVQDLLAGTGGHHRSTSSWELGVWRWQNTLRGSHTTALSNVAILPVFDVS
jgi:hypothetical protein